MDVLNRGGDERWLNLALALTDLDMSLLTLFRLFNFSANERKRNPGQGEVNRL
jgi:hypothetical protein